MITNEYTNRAIDYILNHVNEKISVDEIASHCNFSRYTFPECLKWKPEKASMNLSNVLKWSIVRFA